MAMGSRARRDTTRSSSREQATTPHPTPRYTQVDNAGEERRPEANRTAAAARCSACELAGLLPGHVHHLGGGINVACGNGILSYQVLHLRSGG